MASFALFLVCFFVVCWLFVIAHVVGWGPVHNPLMRPGVLIAYTGAVISVGVFTVAVAAVVIRR